MAPRYGGSQGTSIAAIGVGVFVLFIVLMYALG